jgi:hypothetical protein
LRIEIMSLQNIFALLMGGFLLVFSVIPSDIALAQGSAGGSIGNDDKSVSGSRSEPRAVEPNRSAAPRRSKPDAETPRQATRKSGGGGGGGGNFDGTWSYVGVGTSCQGTGAGSFTVSGSRVSLAGGSGSMGPGGSITSSSVGADGVRVTATGRLSGNSGGGRYTRADGCAGNWAATRN